ncbi:LysR family transcriptional regulator [Streptomyces sp. NPDC002790]|uniref:LysR family transcriptional regulator n=1 Tax=Streptomyces sp. NPDC002790 TaxID=3154431 RepID=UPI003320AFEC
MNFRRAAERLHIAQPALSQQISKFEKDLRTPLFRRTTRHVELTDAGHVLLLQGRRVLAEAEHPLSAVGHAAHGEIGLLRVGFVSSAALGIVPRTVLALQQSWPDLHLELTESTTESQLESISEGRLDVGIVRELDRAAGLTVRPLLRERLVVAVHESHRLADHPCVALADLADERFLTFPRHQVSRLYDHIAALCHRAGFRLEAAQEGVQFPTLLGLVAANTGVTIVPDCLRALRLPALRYRRVDRPRRHLHALRRLSPGPTGVPSGTQLPRHRDRTCLLRHRPEARPLSSSAGSGSAADSVQEVSGAAVVIAPGRQLAVLEGQGVVDDECVEVARRELRPYRTGGPRRRDEFVVGLAANPADLHELPRVRIRLQQDVIDGRLAVLEVAERSEVVRDPLADVVHTPGAVDDREQLRRDDFFNDGVDEADPTAEPVEDGGLAHPRSLGDLLQRHRQTPPLEGPDRS